jgi:prepilin-type N-terminal cleavage/methylation domain-containing protein
VVRIATRDDGFSLIEVMISMIILTVGLLSLVGVAAVGVQRVGANGIFLSGPQSLRLSGPDGLINTADDAAIETIRTAGADNILGNADDVITTLTDYTREIRITPLNYDATGTLNPNLRQIEVIVRYRVDAVWRSYTITTYISSYS